MDGKRKFAVFDVDGTIFRSSLVIALTEELIADGLFDKSVRAGYENERLAWQDRKGSYETYINAVVASFMTHLRGVPYKAFESAGLRAVEQLRDRVYRYTRDLIGDLKRDGFYLLAISHSPKLILEPFCRHLGFDKVYGHRYEVGPEDRFTGEVLDVHLIANKANIVKRAVEKENLTLEGSVGVGDSESDIPMLELVERPICFNPNLALYKAAKRMGWEVVVERKDVIYEISDNERYTTNE